MNITYFFPILAGIILIIKTLRKSDTTDMLGLQNSALTRVVATFCIMYGHTLNAIKDTTIFDSINLGWCWVAVFFFWSGYGVVYSYNKKENYLKGFLYNRGIKILVPFFVAHILYFLVKTAFGIRFSILDIFQGLIGGLNIVEFSWYPIAALFMYVLFYVAWKLPINDIWKIVIVFILTIILTGIEYAIVGIKADWWLISNLAFPIGLLFYYIGKSNKLICIISGGVLTVAGMAMLSLSNRLFGSIPDVIYIIGTNLQTSALAVVMIASFSIFAFLGNKNIIKFLNNISYEMYLCHGLVIFVFTKYVSNGYLVMTLVLTLTPILAYAINLVDKFIIKYLLKIKLKD